MTRAWLAIAIVFAGCKPESARQADRAADNVIEQRKDLKKAVQTEPTEVPAESKQLSRAAAQFIEKRRIRIAALRGEHSVIGTQLALISTLAEHSPITDAGRADINNKLSTFQMQFDIAGNHIEGLAGADVDVWNQRDDAVRDAMDALESARAEAWQALEDAPRIRPNAS